MTNYREIFDITTLERTLKPCSTIIVGVSGGPDSMALLNGLYQMRVQLELTLVAVYVDHLVRGVQSQSDAKFVESFCQDRGIIFRTESIALSGDNPGEEHFRKERYRILKKNAGEFNTKILALGHNLDDKVETFLFHLCRGTGGSGLKFQCISLQESFTIIRPLWNTPRTLIMNYLNGNSISYCTDETNHSNIYTRNSIRNEVIPSLEKYVNIKSKDSIARFINHLGKIYGFVENTVTEKLDEIIAENRSCGFILRSQFFKMNPLLWSEFFYHWIKRNSNQEHTLESAIAAVENWCNSGKSDILQLSECCALILSAEIMWIYPGVVDRSNTDSLADSYGVVFGLNIPARLNMSVQIEFDNCNDGESVYRDSNNNEYVFPFVVEDKILYLRNRRPGDKISHKKKLKDFLTDKKIPFYLKDRVLLAVTKSDVLIAGYWEFQNSSDFGKLCFKKFV